MQNKNKYSFIAYIDESGDIGINLDKSGSSEWFGIAAFIIPADKDLSLVQYKKQIVEKCKLRTKDIHMKEIYNEDKRRFIAQEVGHIPESKCVVVLSNKTSLYKKNIFHTKDSYYQYMSRYLLERITCCCSQCKTKSHKEKGKVKIIFATRGGMNYDKLKKYLYTLRDSPNVNKKINSQKLPKIDWNVIDIEEVQNIPAEKRAGLQFADVLSYSFFKAANKNEYGMVNPGYCLFFKQNMYDCGGRVWHNGVTIVNISELDKECIPCFLEKIFKSSVNRKRTKNNNKTTEKLGNIVEIIKRKE
mgnify:CR=1 FL=1